MDLYAAFESMALDLGWEGLCRAMFLYLGNNAVEPVMRSIAKDHEIVFDPSRQFYGPDGAVYDMAVDELPGVDEEELASIEGDTAQEIFDTFCDNYEARCGKAFDFEC